jgi:hypothetical protein
MIEGECVMENCEFGALFQATYEVRVSLRIQNHPGTGFYARISDDHVFYRGIALQDFDQPRKEVFHIGSARLLDMNKWYFSKSLKNVCNFLFLGVSTELPELLQYLEAEEPTSLEDRLIDAHEKGYQFIIETVWDFGYDVFLLKKNGDVCELREFNSYEVNEVVDWIDLQTNAISIKGDQSQDCNCGK